MDGVHIVLRRPHIHGSALVKDGEPCRRDDIDGLRSVDPAGQRRIACRSRDIVPRHIHFSIQGRALVLRLLIVGDRRHEDRFGIRHPPVLDVSDHGVLGLHLAPCLHLVQDDHPAPGRDIRDHLALDAAGDPEARVLRHLRDLLLAPLVIHSDTVRPREHLIGEIAVFFQKVKGDIDAVAVLNADLVRLPVLGAGGIRPDIAAGQNRDPCVGKAVTEHSVPGTVIEPVADLASDDRKIEIIAVPDLFGVIIGKHVLQHDRIIVFALYTVILVDIGHLLAVGVPVPVVFIKDRAQNTEQYKDHDRRYHLLHNKSLLNVIYYNRVYRMSQMKPSGHNDGTLRIPSAASGSRSVT